MPVGGGPGWGGEIYAYQEEFIRTQKSDYMLPDRRQLEGYAANRGGNAADYVRDLWALQKLRRTVDGAFAEVDLVVVPTQRIPAPLLADFARGIYDPGPKDPHNTSNSGPFNAYGIPAVSVPCGFSRAGLPIGLTIAGPHFAEGKVLALARAYEAATGWNTRRPPLAPA